MPDKTGKIAHIAGTPKKSTFAQKSQFFPSTTDTSQEPVQPCRNYNSMLFPQRSKEDLPPAKSSFEPNAKTAPP